MLLLLYFIYILARAIFIWPGRAYHILNGQFVSSKYETCQYIRIDLIELAARERERGRRKKWGETLSIKSCAIVTQCTCNKIYKSIINIYSMFYGFNIRKMFAYPIFMWPLCSRLPMRGVRNGTTQKRIVCVWIWMHYMESKRGYEVQKDCMRLKRNA